MSRRVTRAALYFTVPATMCQEPPQAKSGIALTLVLAVTLPFSLTLGTSFHLLVTH